MGLKSFLALGLLPQLLSGVSAGVICSYRVSPSPSATCEDVARTWGLSLDEFKALNPSVDCPTLHTGHGYCVLGTVTTSPTTTTPPPKTTTTPSTTLKTTTTSTPSAPSPTQPGLAENCDKFYLVQSGDQCNTIESQFGISPPQFQTWNPFINDDCSNLWLDYYVCVHVPGATTTSAGTSPTPTATGPQPQMPGIVDTCDHFYRIQSGDTCAEIESQFSISAFQFLAWNPSIHAECDNLWQNFYVCVHTPGATTTANSPTPTPTASGPQPQMPGIPSDCKDFHMVQSGDSCYVIEQANGITLNQFLSWNPTINDSCSNLWLGYWVCVGV